MKIQFISIIFFLITSLVYGVDNRSAPNVFSSGSTISSSQMNENFNFLASEIREKDVDCNNGETISVAINEGTHLPLEGIVMEQLRYTSYPHLHMDFPTMTCQTNQSHI